MNQTRADLLQVMHDDSLSFRIYYRDIDEGSYFDLICVETISSRGLDILVDQDETELTTWDNIKEISMSYYEGQLDEAIEKVETIIPDIAYNDIASWVLSMSPADFAHLIVDEGDYENFCDSFVDADDHDSVDAFASSFPFSASAWSEFIRYLDDMGWSEQELFRVSEIRINILSDSSSVAERPHGFFQEVECEDSFDSGQSVWDLVLNNAFYRTPDRALQDAAWDILFHIIDYKHDPTLDDYLFLMGEFILPNELYEGFDDRFFFEGMDDGYIGDGFLAPYESEQLRQLRYLAIDSIQ